jgi:putative hydrolase of the HAD superfamily
MKIFTKAAFSEPPSCILLDLDNTLYDYEPCHAAGQAAARALAQQTLNLSPTAFDRCYADARAELKQRLGPTAASHSRLLYFQRTVERAGFATQPFVALQLEQAYWRAYLESAALADQAYEFLDDLRIAGVPAVIVTDLTAQIQLRKLVILGLDRLVDWMVTSEESGADKPAAAGFELALGKIGGVEGPVWMIGDDVECDLQGAKRAVGAVTLQKLTGNVRPAANGGEADAVFGSFRELRKLLREILERRGAPAAGSARLAAHG